MKTNHLPPAALQRLPRLAEASRFKLDALEPRMLLSASSLALLVDALSGPAEVTSPSVDPLGNAGQSPSLTDATASAWTAASTADVTSVLDVGAGLQHVSGSTVGAELAASTQDAVPALTLTGGRASVAVAFDEAWAKVREVLKTHHTDSWFGFFPGADTAPNSAWMARADAAVHLIEAGLMPWTLVQVSGEVLGQAYAAFAVQGDNGAPSILVNLDRIQSLSDSRDLVTVLVEEIGHGIDYLINGEHDSPGDEGELFAAHVMGAVLNADVRARVMAEDDSTFIQWQGRTVRVEQALSIATDASATSVSYMADDAVTIAGARTVAAKPKAGLDTGDMQIGIDGFSALNGNSSGTADSLILKSDGNVVIKSKVGDADPFSSLTVTGLTVSTAPTSVTFYSNVRVAGDLTIDCTGTV